MDESAAPRPEPYVVLGAQAARTPESRARGLGRVAVDFVSALTDAYPEIVRAVDFGDLKARPAGRGPIVYHVLSPLELLPVETVWPPWARDAADAVVVTLHDLVPLIFGERYFPPSINKLGYRVRLGLVSGADMILAISEATRRDAIDWLGVDPARIRVVPNDCAPVFARATRSPAELVARLEPVLPGLKAGFVLYVGGHDWRKNLSGAIAGYARLEPHLRQRSQLVIVAAVSPQQRRGLETEAASLGVGHQVLLSTGVPDGALAALYQACALFVFPSRYEGFGLPVLEAMRCQAPVVAADNSSLVELVRDADARFPADDPAAMAAVMARALTDAEFRRRLRASGDAAAARYSWRMSVELAVAAYRDALLNRPAAAGAGRLEGQNAMAPPGAGGVGSV